MTMCSKTIVTFYRLYDNSKSATEDNISPYINLAYPDEDISDQRSPNEVVIRKDNIRIQYTYPLHKAIIRKHIADTPQGFTRAYLAREISRVYQTIYMEEDDAIKA